MSKAKSLADEVFARVQNQRPGYQTWVQKLPTELQAELDECRRRFDHTIHQKSAYARAICAAVADRGHAPPKPDAVIRWLSEASRKK